MATTPLYESKMLRQGSTAAFNREFATARAKVSWELIDELHARIGPYQDIAPQGDVFRVPRGMEGRFFKKEERRKMAKDSY